MKKQELIMIHMLLVLVKEELQARDAVSPDAFREYEEFGVRATSVHRHIGPHEKAIWLLLDGIEAANGVEPVDNAPSRPQNGA